MNLSAAMPSLRGASYPLSYRIAATLAMLGLVYGAWQTREALAALEWTSSTLLLAAAVSAMVLFGYGQIMRSQTWVHPDAIEHGWLWTERTAWADVSQVHLLHWPALAWLVAPRLMLRSRGRGRQRIPLSDPSSLRRVREMVIGVPD